MNYYRRYLGDYMRDTAHLSIMEHGAYNLMLDHCYATEKPLPGDLDALYRLCRAMSKPEQDAVRKVVREFFELRDDGHHNPRADREIGVAQSTIGKQRESGAKAAAKRWSESGSGDGSTDGSTHAPINGSTHESTNGSTGGSAIQPPTTNHQPPASNHQQESTTLSGKPDRAPNKPNRKPEALDVLAFLNEKTGRSYQPVDVNVEFITARLNDGASVDEIKGVIERKCAQWLGDQKMEQYLRPATLFNRTNFAQYQGETGTARAERRVVV